MINFKYVVLTDLEFHRCVACARTIKRSVKSLMQTGYTTDVTRSERFDISRSTENTAVVSDDVRENSQGLRWHHRNSNW